MRAPKFSTFLELVLLFFLFVLFVCLFIWGAVFGLGSLIVGSLFCLRVIFCVFFSRLIFLEIFAIYLIVDVHVHINLFSLCIFTVFDLAIYSTSYIPIIIFPIYHIPIFLRYIIVYSSPSPGNPTFLV